MKMILKINHELILINYLIFLKQNNQTSLSETEMFLCSFCILGFNEYFRSLIDLALNCVFRILFTRLEKHEAQNIRLFFVTSLGGITA